MLKKFGSLALAASMFVSTIAPQVASVASVAAGPAAVAAIGAGAVLAPSAAQAQSGSRVCAGRFSTRLGALWFYLEVSKYDLITCGASLATFLALQGNSSVKDFAGGGLTGRISMRYNQVCEKFSSDVNWNGDICNSTARYRLYMVLQDFGARTTLKKV